MNGTQHYWLQFLGGGVCVKRIPVNASRKNSPHQSKQDRASEQCTIKHRMDKRGGQSMFSCAPAQFSVTTWWTRKAIWKSRQTNSSMQIDS